MTPDTRPAAAPDSWAAVHVLSEPTRRRVFEAVRAARGPVTRYEAAAATGISRRLAAFHLDQLAGAGLLETDFARPAGRGGPGAGRPAKRYRAVAGDVAVSLPERRYDLAARVLAAGIRDEGGRADARACALAAAKAEGRDIGAARRPDRTLSVPRTLSCVADALGALGYEPEREGGSTVRLRNCPFHAVVDVDAGLMCGINAQFIAGLLDGLGAHRDVTATLAPSPPDCCVTVAARRRGSRSA